MVVFWHIHRTNGPFGSDQFEPSPGGRLPGGDDGVAVDRNAFAVPGGSRSRAWTSVHRTGTEPAPNRHRTGTEPAPVTHPAPP
jgi:hypothetical protein